MTVWSPLVSAILLPRLHLNTQSTNQITRRMRSIQPEICFHSFDSSRNWLIYYLCCVYVTARPYSKIYLLIHPSPSEVDPYFLTFCWGFCKCTQEQKSKKKSLQPFWNVVRLRKFKKNLFIYIIYESDLRYFLDRNFISITEKVTSKYLLILLSIGI